MSAELLHLLSVWVGGVLKATLRFVLIKWPIRNSYSIVAATPRQRLAECLGPHWFLICEQYVFRSCSRILYLSVRGEITLPKQNTCRELFIINSSTWYLVIFGFVRLIDTDISYFLLSSHSLPFLARSILSSWLQMLLPEWVLRLSILACTIHSSYTLWSSLPPLFAALCSKV